MKKRFIRLCLLAVVIALAVGTVEAQAPATRKKTKRSTTKKKTNTNKNSAGKYSRGSSKGYHSKTCSGI